MPLSATRVAVPALSEITSINLLKKTEALEKFRKWLLKERYKRQMTLTGVKYSRKLKIHFVPEYFGLPTYIPLYFKC